MAIQWVNLFALPSAVVDYAAGIRQSTTTEEFVIAGTDQTSDGVTGCLGDGGAPGLLANRIQIQDTVGYVFTGRHRLVVTNESEQCLRFLIVHLEDRDGGWCDSVPGASLPAGIYTYEPEDMPCLATLDGSGTASPIDIFSVIRAIGTYDEPTEPVNLRFVLEFEVDVAEEQSRYPIAVDDTATTTENTPVNIDVLANDVLAYDTGEDPITPGDLVREPAVVEGPAHGSAVWDAEINQFVYTPDEAFCGEDIFEYDIAVVGDEEPQVASAFVSVTVECTPPVDPCTRTIQPPGSAHFTPQYRLSERNGLIVQFPGRADRNCNQGSCPIPVCENDEDAPA